MRKGQNYLIGSDIFLNVVELQINRSERQDQAQFNEMMRFFARESYSGTKVTGVLSKRDLMPFRPN